MYKRIYKIGSIVLLLIFIVVTLAFTSMEYSQATCGEIKIEYKADDKITIDKAVIRKIVTGVDKDIIGKKFDQINTALIEEEVEKNASVQNAEVFEVVAKDTGIYKGILTVKIKHREPLLRIITQNESYYLDKNGHKFPVSSGAPAHVLVVTGKVEEHFARNELLSCILYIENDEFWSAQIEQVHVENNGEIILTPLIGDHIIELGTLDNYPEKLRNMKVFYKKVLAKNNWNKYKSISLKYNNQVIAKRR